MKFLNPKARITMGLIGVITSLVMLAFFHIILPDRNSAVRESRVALAIAITVSSTTLVKTEKSQRQRDDFNLLAERNKNLFSLALLHKSGNLLFSTGDQTDRWEEMTGEYSKDSLVSVRIWSGEQKWG
jgi:hypothetical protein